MTPRFSVVIDGFEVNFYLRGGIVGWIGKFFFSFFTFFSWNFVIYRPEFDPLYG